MATVIGCSGGGGRLIAVDTQSATPLALSLKYTEELSLAELLAQQSPQVNSGPIVVNAQETLIRLGIATSVQCAQQVVAQFQKALNTAIYITPFGDAVGDAQIKFIVNRKCEDGADVSGFDVIQHYLDRRLLTTKNKLPATLVIGSGTFQGFLVGLMINGQSGDIPVVEGTLQFKAWPA